jgi:hypothetical protein
MVDSIRAMSSSALFRGISGLTFKKGDEVLSPSEAFEAMYVDLDPLLEANYEHCYRGGEAVTEREGGAFISKWKNGIYQKGITAEASLSLGEIATSLSMSVSPRSNLHPDRARRPNIVLLRDSVGHLLYFRKAEFYGPVDHPNFENLDFNGEETWDPASMLHKRDLTDKTWYRNFHKGDKRRFNPNFKRTIIRQHFPSGDRRPVSIAAPYIFIPEPHLHAVLESMYNEGMQRITPVSSVVETNGSSVYFLRPSLTLFIDGEIMKSTMSKLGSHFGVLQALGLRDTYDRQLDHYASQSFPSEGEDSLMVNYDPDFMVMDRRSARSRTSDDFADMRLFRRQVTEKYRYISGSEWKTFDGARREAKNRTEKLFGGDPQREFYDRLRTSFDHYETLNALKR